MPNPPDAAVPAPKVFAAPKGDAVFPALPPMVGRVRVGEQVKLKIMRDGKLNTVKVTIGQLPDSDQAVAGVSSPWPESDALNMKLGRWLIVYVPHALSWVLKLFVGSDFVRGS